MLTELSQFERIRKLPKHLSQFAVSQNYPKYSQIDQEVWRYVMRQNTKVLKDIAHESYLDGLKQTGISIDKIPDMATMNEALEKIGWGALTVDGFIPPSTFMEFQAYKVLVIASDIRQLEHIGYTPAPDIIHEASGHAPIIANPEYAEYLRLFGEVGSKAISSSLDYQLYEAIRHLSIVKETPNSDPKDIKIAEQKVYDLQNSNTNLSEMAMVRNLHWWTVEYGLIGTIDNPKIYGAGLLSSISEGLNCLTDEVKKLPYDISAASQSFDITKPQPQLYVTPTFYHLTKVLEAFLQTLSLTKGGVFGITKAKESQQLSTIELDSGVQVSGIVSDFIQNEYEQVIYMNTTGSTALAYQYVELVGHSKYYHKEGFGSPIGKLKGFSTSLYHLTNAQLSSHGIVVGEKISLQFESGVTVNGTLKYIRRNGKGKILILTFLNCTVKLGDKILFQPEWGNYDMVVGEYISSVFSGAADTTNFEEEIEPPKEKTQVIALTGATKELNLIYQSIDQNREKLNLKSIETLWHKLKTEFPKDWLAPLNIYELVYTHPQMSKMTHEIATHLQTLAQNPEIKQLILSGLEMVEQK